MEEQVVQALFNCIQADANIRKSGEFLLESIKTEPGFGVLLLQISHNLAHSLPIRQLAAIVLKNQVKKWKDSNLHANDKEFLKNNVIQCMKFSVTESIRGQFEEIAYNISRYEKSWEGLTGQIHAYLDSGDADMVYAGLSILNQSARQYEFVLTEKRSNLKFLMHQFFPKLEVLLDKLLREANESAYHYINIILQLYWTSFYIELSPEQATEQNLDLWIDKLRTVLLIPFEEIQLTDFYEKEAKTKEPKMMCKKWASQILYRFFSRYHDFYAQLETNKMIGHVFISKWMRPVLEIIIAQTFSHSLCFIPDVVLNYYIKFINQAVKFPSSLEYLKGLQLPNGEFIIPELITKVITPILCKTPRDQELWTDNPIEYIRKEADLSQTYYSASSASVDLLETICERGYLQQFLQYLNGSLSTNIDLLTKEALINEVGSLSEVIRKHENLAVQVQEMLALYIFPELSNTLGFLRARAAWAYGQFSSFPFSNIDHQKSVLEKICNLVLDSDLPVKYEAALTLPKILSWEISKSRVSGEISNVLKIYLDLINEIDSEEIIEALEDIVTSYSAEVLPFAIELSQQLAETFTRLAGKEHVGEEDDSAMAAVSVLNTLNKIIETVSDKSQELLKISEIVRPLLQYSLSKEGSAYMEEGLNILSSLLYFAPAGTLTGLFGLCTIVLHSLSENDPYGMEKTEEVFPVLANFIGKYPGQAGAETEHLVRFLLDLVKEDGNVTILACKLLIVAFERLKNNISPLVPMILERLYAKIQSTESHKTKTICCQVVYVALWADTLTALTYLDQSNTFKPLFNYSLNNFKYIKEKISRTQVILGISAVVPYFTSYPNSLSLENSLQIFKKLVEMVILLEGDQEDTDTNSPFVDAEEFNSNAQEILNKIRENIEESDDDSEVLYETDADEFYDSIFEDIKYKTFAKNELAKSEILNKLLENIDIEEKNALEKIFASC